jgi:hypothetical protein
MLNFKRYVQNGEIDYKYGDSGKRSG